MEAKPDVTSAEAAAQRRNRRGAIVVSAITFTATAGLLFGPNALHAYQDSQAIEAKKGPATDYVHTALGATSLSPIRLTFSESPHACSNGPSLGPGDYARTCAVRGEATYIFQDGKTKQQEEDAALEILRDKGLLAKDQKVPSDAMALRTINYEGQDLAVAVDLVAYTADEYNHRSPYPTDDPRVSPNSTVVGLKFVAYTVQRSVPDYPYNGND